MGRIDLELGTHLQPVLSPIPLHWGREKVDVVIDSGMSSELFVVGRQNHFVFASGVYTDPIVGKRIGRVD